MTSEFVRLAREKLAPAFDLNSQTFTHLPMATPAADRNAAPVPDPSRSVRDFEGIFYALDAKPLISNAFDPRTTSRPGSMGDHPRIEIPLDEEGFVLDVRKDDIFESLDGPRWQVIRFHQKRTGILVVFVSTL